MVKQLNKNKIGNNKPVKKIETNKKMTSLFVSSIINKNVLEERLEYYHLFQHL